MPITNQQKIKNINPEALWHCPHFNDNRCCIIAIKTTGLDPKIHEICQLCIFPTDSRFNLARDVIPFYTDVRPIKNSLNLEWNKGFITMEKYVKACNEANPPQQVAKLFDSWFENKLNLRPGKKILPLCHDWAHMKPFLKNWLGRENFKQYFSRNYRDLIPLTLFMNDYADFHTEQVPYPKSMLSFITNIHKVEHHRFDDTILWCKAISEVYQIMLKEFYRLY